jgi:hypothetical protein
VTTTSLLPATGATAAISVSRSACIASVFEAAPDGTNAAMPFSRPGGRKLATPGFASKSRRSSAGPEDCRSASRTSDSAGLYSTISRVRTIMTANLKGLIDGCIDEVPSTTGTGAISPTKSAIGATTMGKVMVLVPDATR